MMKNTFEIISFEDAKIKYSLEFDDYYIEEVYENQQIAIFHDDTHFESLDVDAEFFSSNLKGCIFLKNLTVDSYVVQSESDFGPLFIVFGILKAKNLFISGAECYFRNDVLVDQLFIAGVYNHGTLSVSGNISAKVIYSHGHAFRFKQNHIKNSILIIGNEDEPRLTDIFLPQFFDDDDLDEVDDMDLHGYLNTNLIADTIKLDQQVIILGKIPSKLDKAIIAAESSGFTKINLNNLKLANWPDALAEKREWQEIIINNDAFLSIPEYFSDFSELSALSLDRCELNELPEVITTLSGLVTLSLRFNNLESLPEQLIKLENLKNLDLTCCNFSVMPKVFKSMNLNALFINRQYSNSPLVIEGIETLERLFVARNVDLKLIGEFPNLIELDLSACDLNELPATIINAPKLKKLNIEGNLKIRSIPPEFANLRALEEFSFFQNMRGLEHLRDIKTLKKVTISGAYDANQIFIEQLLALESWEELTIPNGYDNEILFRIIDRPNLKRLIVGSWKEESVDELRRKVAQIRGK